MTESKVLVQPVNVKYEVVGPEKKSPPYEQVDRVAIFFILNL